MPGTIAVCDIDDNLIQGPVKPWPSAELLQKLYAADRSDSFETGNYSALARRLGFYCNVQSINSEDAMTWSYFGPLVHANAEVRAQFMAWLLSRIGVAESTDGCSIWLWRRIVHPDKPISPGGPEIDFGLHSSTTVILGEAKWQSKVGKGQGVNRDKDQIQLRREALEKFGPALFPSVRTFVVLGVGIDRPVACESVSTLDGGARVVVCNLGWTQLCAFGGHPVGAEIAAYYEWKHFLTRTPAGRLAGTGISTVIMPSSSSGPA